MRLKAEKAFDNFLSNFCPKKETNEVPWYANGLSSRVTRFARDNKRQILSKKTSYIENPDYVILTEFNIIENEFWDQFFIFSILSKVSLISRIYFRYV